MLARTPKSTFIGIGSIVGALVSEAPRLSAAGVDGDAIEDWIVNEMRTGAGGGVAVASAVTLFAGNLFDGASPMEVNE